MPDSISFADLRATVYRAHVPAGLADELPSLYSSLCSTQEWSLFWDGVAPEGACTLSDPRHVLLFTRTKGTIEILNRVFEISPADAERACRALFRAFPHVHRIHLEVMFPPEQVRLPHRVLYGVTHMVIDLPSTTGEYTASLSKNMRKSLKYHQRRLKRDFEIVSTDVVSPETCSSQELYDLFSDWKTTRFEAHARELGLVGPKLAKLLDARGEAHVTSVDGREAAIKFVFPVGDTLYIGQSAFDPAYEPYGLGTVTSYWTVCAAIERGMRRVSFMWGTEPHKQRLGARPRQAFRLSVFPNQTARMHSLGESRDVLVRVAKERGTGVYWRTRRQVGRWIRRRIPGRGEQSSETEAQGRQTDRNDRQPPKGPFRYRDLGAVVHPAVDPTVYAAELEILYSSLFSTVDWFETHDDPPWMGACILERPRHLLMFTGSGDTVKVLNKAFAIEPSDAERACRALFRAFPHVRRIHIEVMFPPSALSLSRRVLYTTDHMVVDLPPTVEEFVRSVSRSKHLRSHRNRVKRDFDDVSAETIPSSDARTPSLFKQLLEWKTASFAQRGRQTYWEDDPQLIDRFEALLRRRGEIRLTRADSRLVTIAVDFPVGECLCAQETASDPDPALARYGIPLLSDYWSICDAIPRGLRSVNLLWGTEEFKSRLGATPRRASALSVFRTPTTRLWSLDEEWEVARRNTTRRAAHEYWRTRRAAGRILRAHGVIKR